MTFSEFCQQVLADGQERAAVIRWRGQEHLAVISPIFGETVRIMWGINSGISSSISHISQNPELELIKEAELPPLVDYGYSVVESPDEEYYRREIATGVSEDEAQRIADKLGHPYYTIYGPCISRWPMK